MNITAPTAIRQTLLNQGLWSAKAMPVEAIGSLIERLHPVATEHPLIRLGGDGDGGYLVPDDLDRLGACFSPGVSSVADFEMSLAHRGVP